MRRGFALVEVIVSLVIFSVGVLGAAGVVIAAAGTLRAARGLEAAGALALEVADSLALFGVGGSGARNDGRGSVVWTVEAGGSLARVRIEARVGGRSRGVSVVALLPSGGPTR